MTQAVLEKERPAEAGIGVVDCDIHPALTSPAELAAYMPARWQEHVRNFGMPNPGVFVGALAYPRLAHGMRQDSWPPNGGPPASDVAFLQEQLLDGYNIEYGILQPLSPGHGALNPGLAAALCAATNDWQIDKWMNADKRLRGSIAVPQEDAADSVREIEARAKDKRFSQISITPRTMEPAGRKRYWPIFEAAEHYGIPIGMHSAAYGARSNTAAGWTSFYIEEHFAFSNAAQTSLISMIFEGVFDAFPKLKLVLVEGGFAWYPALMWRMEREWDRMRKEVPHLKRSPMEYCRDNVYLTTQPIEEPFVTRHMNDILRWIGVDKLLFSTDYPHWDFDDPQRAFKVPLDPADKRAILRDNAVRLFGLE